MKKQTHKLLTLFILTSSINSLQAATPAKECKTLFDKGLSQQAISPCSRAAEAGDSPAQTMLGEIYDEMGDSKKTALWWKRAAQADYQPARNLLALKYYYGGTVFGPQKGWVQDHTKAFNIWLQDAGRGIATSQFMVGVMYHKGEGVSQDPSEAWYWLKVALQNGYKLATDVLIELSKQITPEQRRLGEEKLASYQKQNADTASAIMAIDPYVRAIPPGQTTSAMFLGLENSTAKNRSLIKVHSDVAKHIELHEHVHEDGMMKMRQVPKIEVAANSKTILKPSGYHVMLINLNRAIAPGDKIHLTLAFDDGSKQAIVAEVRKINMGMGEMKH